MSKLLASSSPLDAYTYDTVRQCSCCGAVLETKQRVLTPEEFRQNKEKEEHHLRLFVDRVYGEGQGANCRVVWAKQRGHLLARAYK